MKQEIAKELAYNLRSGEYEQLRTSLRDYDSFCCLGVLTDMYCKVTGNIWTHPIQVDDWSGAEEVDDSVYEVFGESEVLPDKVMAWAEMNTNTGDIQNLNTSLMELNDGNSTKQIHPHSFREIADIIEQNWEDL